MSDPVTHYASEVTAGRIVAGPLVRLACKRHLDDLEHGPGRGLKWDIDAALWHIGFFPDVLRLAEGEHAGQPFHLQPWQQFVQGSLFGWKRWKDEHRGWFRRFETAYIEIGKGNGKSPMAGGTGLYMMEADNEPGAHCFAAAVTREQASILFRDAVTMVDSSPGLAAKITKSGKKSTFNLADLRTNSFFRPVSSEGRGLDGKRVHYAALDEIHEHPDATVVDKMRAGTKGRRQALVYEITNSGCNRHSVCWNHHEYSGKVLEGIYENDSWFAYVCGLDEGDDWKDERVWPKVNPNLGVSITLDYLRRQVREAIGMPSQENIVKRLNFCIWTEQATRAIPMEAWDRPEAAAPFDIESLRGRRCFGGKDLARVNDLSAFVLLFPPVVPGGRYTVLAWFWVPEEDIQMRTHRDHVPYDVWEREQLITATPGNVTDFAFIKQKIVELAGIYDIAGIGFDRTFAGEIVQDLQRELGEKRMVQIGQGFPGMASPVGELLRMIKGCELQHGGNKVLRWNASNFATMQDPAGNLKPDKQKSWEKIDGISALCDAIGVMQAMGSSTVPSVYETRGLLSV